MDVRKHLGDQRGPVGKAADIVGGAGLLAAQAAVGHVEQQQLAQQRVPIQLVRLAKELLDGRPLARLAGRLEAVAEVVQLQARRRERANRRRAAVNS